MRKSVRIAGPVEIARQRGGRYRMMFILAAIVALLALATSASGHARASEATRLQRASGSDAPSVSTPADPPRLAAPLGQAAQQDAAVAYNSARNEYLLVWLNQGGDLNSADIYGQRVSSSGALLGNDFLISPASGHQSAPAVVYNSGSDEYLAIWRQQNEAFGSADIYGQRVSSNGALVGNAIPISTAPGHQEDPAVVYNSTSGEYLAVWDDARSGTSSDIYGQRVSSSGTLLGSELPISTAPDSQFDPGVAYSSGSGEYLVVWTDNRGSTSDIYGQRVSSSGTLAGSDLPISTAISAQIRVAVAYNSVNGEYLIVWTDTRGIENDIYGQRVSGSGGLAGNEIPITTANEGQNQPAVAHNSATGEYLVAWTDQRNSISADIYGQRVSSGGALAGNAIPVSTASGHQSIPAVAYNRTSGEYLAVWEDARGGDYSKIYGQRLSAAGAHLGGDFCTYECTPGGTSTPTATTTPITMATSTPTATGSPTACLLQFTDVPADHAFYPNIRCLACRGIISGYSDGTFLPGNNVTRGQIAKIVSNAAGWSEPVSGQTFSDVAPPDTFYQFVERMARRGIIGGYADGTFRPGNNATRGQISKIVSNTAGFTEPVSGQTFSDVPPAHTFYEFVERMARRGIIGGYTDGTFRPENNATRGQTSKIVANSFFPACATP